MLGPAPVSSRMPTLLPFTEPSITGRPSCVKTSISAIREYLHLCAGVAAFAAALAASRISAKLRFRISGPLTYSLRDDRTVALALADERGGRPQEASSYRMSGKRSSFAGTLRGENRPALVVAPAPADLQVAR